MRNRFFRIISTVWLPAMGFLLPTGCVERELEVRPADYAENVRIALDWGTLSAPPQSVRYLFYNEDGTLEQEATQATADFAGTLPAGRYRLIVHNDDALQVDYRGMEAYPTAEVFAMPATASRSADRSYILEPQAIYATGVCSEGEWITVKPGAVTQATARPLPLTHKVQFRFIVKGDIETASFTGVLGGVVPGIYLATGKVSASQACSTRFTAESVSQDEGVGSELFTAHLNVFNLLTCADSPAETNTIDAVLTDTEGKEHSASVDITEALQEIIGNNEGEIPIEIPVEVQLEVSEIGNITSTVRPWEEGGSGGGSPGVE